MWDRKEIKAYGKAKFKANYWKSVLAALLLSVLTCGSALSSRFSSDDTDTTEDDTFNEATDAFNNLPDDEKPVVIGIVLAVIGALMVVSIIFVLLKIFVFNPLEVGCYGFFKENARGYQPDLGILKTGFTQYGHTFVTLLLRDVFLVLWTCLFIVPGLVKSYSYRMVPFILRDHPELSAKEVITESRRLMDGQKWNVFVFDLSYIGWALLGCITLGLVNVFWTEPYRQNANAAIYLKLIGEEEFKPEEPIALSSELS